MAQHELNQSFSEDPAIQSSICARCGKAAEVRLTLLGKGPHGSENFCLSCGEAHLHDLRKQPKVFAYTEQAANQLPGFASTNVKNFLHSDVAFDEMESGIVFWEGHGWSSDGPFAGA